MQSQTPQQITKLLTETRITLTQMATNLEKQTMQRHREQMCTKLKIIIGLISESSGIEELQGELVEFGDGDLVELVKGVREKMGTGVVGGNGGGNGVASAGSGKPEQPKPAQKRPERVKQKQAPKNNKNNNAANRSGSLLKGMIGKFIKLEDDSNVRQMILPQKQAKVVFDPVKGKYVFQGQEEQEVKQIPKPPPAKKLLNATAPATKKKEKLNELEEMMAPPAFKRKGMKKKEDKEQPKTLPVQYTFQKLHQLITNQLQDTSQKILTLLSQQLQPSKPAFPTQSLTMLKNLSEEIRSAQELSDTMMTRLYSSYIDSQFDDEIGENMMEKILNLDRSSIGMMEACLQYRAQKKQEREKDSKEVVITVSQEEKDKISEQIKKMEEEIELLRLENGNLRANVEVINKGLSDQREKYRLNLQSQVSQNKMIKLVIEQKKNQIVQLQKLKHLKQSECQQHKTQLTVTKNQLKSLQQKLASFHSSLHSQQQQILKLLLQKTTQSSLLSQLTENLTAEQELYHSIQAKRMHVCMQGKDNMGNGGRAGRGEQKGMENESHARNSLFQLSDALSRVVEFYEGQLTAIKKECMAIGESYQMLRTESNRVQQNMNAQNLSLQRSLTRLKSLIQDHKQSKQQLQIKVAQLENENNALQRQLTHLRKQHSYTKQILEQNIRSSHDNTATLKQQLQSQIKSLQEQLQQKQTNQKLLQQQVSQTSSQINQLIRQNKIKSNKILSLQKDLKQLKEQLDIKELKCEELGMKMAELEKNVEVMGGRLADEKERYEGILGALRGKVKDIGDENGRLRGELKSAKREIQDNVATIEESKRQNQEIMGILEESNRQNETLRAQNQQLSNFISKKDKQLAHLTSTIQQNQSIIQQHTQNQQSLLQQLESQKEEISKMRVQLQQYTQLHQQHQSHTETLLQQLYTTKIQFQAMEQDFMTRVSGLGEKLLENQRETEELARLCAQYEGVCGEMGGVVGLLGREREENQKLRGKAEELEGEILRMGALLEEKQGAGQVDQLRKQIAAYNEQVNTHIKQNTRLNKLLHQKQTYINSLKSQLQITEEQRNTFQQITFQMQSQLNIKTQSLTSTTQSLQNLKQVLVTKSAESAELVKVNGQREREIELLTARISEMEGQKVQSGELQKRIGEAVDDKNKEILKRDQMIEALSNQCNVLDEVQTQNARLLAQEIQLKGKIDSLERDLKQSDLLISDLSAKLEQMQKQNEGQQNRQKQKQQGFQQTIDELLQKVKQKQQAIQAQQKQITALNQEIIRLSKQPSQKSNKSISNTQKQKDGQKELTLTQPTKMENGGNGLKMKDKLINNIQLTKDEIHRKVQEIQRLAKVIADKENELVEANRTINENNTNIENLLLSLQQKNKQNQQLLAKNQQLSRQMLALIQKQNDPQAQDPTTTTNRNIYTNTNNNQQIKSTQSLSQQQQQLQQLIMAQNSTVEQQKSEIQKLTADIERLTGQLEEARNSLGQAVKDKNQLHELYIQKSEQADKTIERMEAELREGRKWEAELNAMQAKFKDLQLENSELLSEKSQLLKTKNQILARLSAQRGQPLPQPKKQQPSNANPQSLKQPLTQVQSPTAPVQVLGSTSAIKQQISSSTQNIQKPSGFLSSLSSLFLTPTENQKLIKPVKK